MPRKTKAELAAEEHQREVDVAIAETKMYADLMCGTIMKLREEGMHWDKIGKLVGIPGYCCMVLAKQTVRNREPAKSQR